MKIENATKRLTIDLTKEEHLKLKLLASFEGVTMKSYLLSRSLHNQKSKKDETEYLLKSKKNRERIIKGLSSKVSGMAFASIKDLKYALGV
ncbi:MAG: antitoxin [Patescibacteria group bacterium]|nr:antitoxin [Patescibacteria group bacterium]